MFIRHWQSKTSRRLSTNPHLILIRCLIPMLNVAAILNKMSVAIILAMIIRSWQWTLSQHQGGSPKIQI
jgi:hypothetical protein